MHRLLAWRADVRLEGKTMSSRWWEKFSWSRPVTFLDEFDELCYDPGNLVDFFVPVAGSYGQRKYEYLVFVPTWVEIATKGGKVNRCFDGFSKACPLYECSACGRLGGPQRIQYRSTASILCMGCWNSIRAIYKKEDSVLQCRRLINKLKKVIHDEHKNKDDRRAEAVSVRCDSGSQERRHEA